MSKKRQTSLLFFENLEIVYSPTQSTGAKTQNWKTSQVESQNSHYSKLHFPYNPEYTSAKNNNFRHQILLSRLLVFN